MSYATPEEVAARLGRTFTPEETTQATALLEGAADSIAAACGHEVGWSPEDVPAGFKEVSIQAATRGMLNPAGQTSESEQLGSYQHGTNYAESAAGSSLTRREVLAVRRAYFGSNAAAPRVRGLVDDVIEEVR